ncbi:hypothetical protein BDZ94DRAFT_1309409 [Collybia nuda]|uniref:HNH nuclease domain-containing protein n=1 Tax=Collybia nuda TaxID=64659 RepID=A0A9P5Y5P1_9AGAR|nr:hypothetical protein BDZ94DRAFT_1309409 [Collybia nuda]
MDATAHSSEIKIYASFLLVVAKPGADFNFAADNWNRILCLTLPLETLGVLQFSHKPYKWICYAIGIVVEAEGHLSSSPYSLTIVDYNAGLPIESAALYYHTSDDENSVVTPRKARLRSDAADRDGHQCISTAMNELLCDAVHLLAHNKGDTYISTYTEHCSQDPADGDLIQDIDSVQNALFFNKLTHTVVGKNIAFLPTPKFAMNTADIDLTVPGFLGDAGAPPSGSPLRISDTPGWPPAIILDAIYASAVPHHFRIQTLKDVVSETWMDTLYSNGIIDQLHPPRWTPPELPVMISLDTPPIKPQTILLACPPDPLLRVARATRPGLNLRALDFISDRRNLRVLLDFVEGGNRGEHIDTETIGGADLFFLSWPGPGYGHPSASYGINFEKCFTSALSEITVQHNRVINYTLGWS